MRAVDDGDLVVADDPGVLLVPQARAEGVIAGAEAIAGRGRPSERLAAEAGVREARVHGDTKHRGGLTSSCPEQLNPLIREAAPS